MTIALKSTRGGEPHIPVENAVANLPLVDLVGFDEYDQPEFLDEQLVNVTARCTRCGRKPRIRVSIGSLVRRRRERIRWEPLSCRHKHALVVDFVDVAPMPQTLCGHCSRVVLALWDFKAGRLELKDLLGEAREIAEKMLEEKKE